MTRERFDEQLVSAPPGRITTITCRMRLLNEGEPSHKPPSDTRAKKRKRRPWLSGCISKTLNQLIFLPARNHGIMPPDNRPA